MLKMLLVGLMVAAAACLVSAQQSSNCECYAYFVCENRTWNTNVDCEYHNEVCCELDAVPTNTTPPPSPATVSQVPRDTPGGICGVRKEEVPGVTWKINVPSGGDTHFGEFPWMAAILRKSTTGQRFLCGGSVIYPNIILTAAHTVSGIPSNELVVKAGVWDTTDVSEQAKHQNRQVIQVLSHPGFDKKKVANDFALLVLDEPLAATDNVGPVCLPSSSMPINQSSCTATGWGADKFGNQIGNVLKKVDLPLVDFDSCERKLKASKLGSKFKLHDSFLCAGGNAEGDTCLGDGGGPLMCATLEDPDRYVQIGVTAWGVGCGQGTPGAYSSVQVAADWIQSQGDNFPPISKKISSL